MTYEFLSHYSSRVQIALRVSKMSDLPKPDIGIFMLGLAKTRVCQNLKSKSFPEGSKLYPKAFGWYSMWPSWCQQNVVGIFLECVGTVSFPMARNDTVQINDFGFPDCPNCVPKLSQNEEIVRSSPEGGYCRGAGGGK